MAADKDVIKCHFCRKKPSKFPNTIGKMTVGSCGDCKNTKTHDFCDIETCNYLKYYGFSDDEE